MPKFFLLLGESSRYATAVALFHQVNYENHGEKIKGWLAAIK
jgi:hypothetical protein